MERIVSLAFANYPYLAILLVPYLSYMLYDFTQPNMIFSFYGDWLRNGKNDFIKKTLGLCLKCFHVWLSMLVFGILVDFDILFFISIKFILALSLSYGILIKEYY